MQKPKNVILIARWSRKRRLTIELMERKRLDEYLLINKINYFYTKILISISELSIFKYFGRINMAVNQLPTEQLCDESKKTLNFRLYYLVMNFHQQTVCTDLVYLSAISLNYKFLLNVLFIIFINSISSWHIILYEYFPRISVELNIDIIY